MLSGIGSIPKRRIHELFSRTQKFMIPKNILKSQFRASIRFRKWVRKVNFCDFQEFELQLQFLKN